jgi:RNA polymerase sigma-70 factor (ECF subfamily)
VNRPRVFAEHRPRLLAIAYRMLGSTADAEDVVQEAFIRWNTAGDDAIASPKAYLSTVVTRLCIDAKKSARARREEYVGPWLPEPLEDDLSVVDPPSAALAESVHVGFLLLLEKLAPVERAVFLLHHVFDFEYEEIASMVGKSAANCRQIAARARDRLREGRRRFVVSVEEQRRVAAEFVESCHTGDVDRLLRVLASDAVLYADGGGKAPAFGKISAATRPLVGREQVARFALAVMGQAPAGFTWRRALLNRQEGVLGYLEGALTCALVFDVEGGLVRNVYIVVNPSKLERLSTSTS